jgi:hypothetical protein
MKKRTKAVVVILMVVACFASICEVGQLWDAMSWQYEGKDFRKNLTTCAHVKEQKLPPYTSEVFSATKTIRLRDSSEEVYYNGLKMCNGVLVTIKGQEYILAFTEARSGPHDSSLGAPTPPHPVGSCDDRGAHTVVIFCISSDGGKTWTQPEMMTSTSGESYADVTAGVNYSREEIVVVMIAGHRKFVRTTMSFDTLQGNQTPRVFSDVRDITSLVHPADQMGSTQPETYVNTGHTSTVYNSENSELIFPASTGGKAPRPFLIVQDSEDEWTLRGQELITDIDIDVFEPAIAHDGGSKLVMNCRQRISPTLSLAMTGNRRVQMISSDWGSTWERGDNTRVRCVYTNVYDSFLTEGSTAGIAFARGLGTKANTGGTNHLYYAGPRSHWLRRGLTLHRSGADPNTYTPVKELHDTSAMTPSILVGADGEMRGVIFEDGGPVRRAPLMGLVFQAQRVLYRYEISKAPKPSVVVDEITAVAVLSCLIASSPLLLLGIAMGRV